jgi:hypothetical protein
MLLAALGPMLAESASKPRAFDHLVLGSNVKELRREERFIAMSLGWWCWRLRPIGPEIVLTAMNFTGRSKIWRERKMKTRA